MKNISPQRWSEIEAILDKVLDADPPDRQALVEKLCEGDEDLRTQVVALLKAGDKAADFLEDPQHEHFEKALAQMAADDEDDGDDPNLNRTVGPYRLIRRLGRGGMGQVYLGSRADDTFDKFVAVKLIRRGMDTDEILQRFRTERRILASLVHPNIARLLDGGATEDGLSYFVMDYVDGSTITDYADRERLSVRERLELFKKVCSAVHHAHQNLIVHRDLKPSNILVDADGEVKLLDFGIAKFLHPEETNYTVPVTREEARIMTPEYASPEQARGETLTTASDVYQLGILLYEMLTGTRPYDFSNERRAEIERIICETEPERPSTAIVNTTESVGTGSTDGDRWNTPIERIRKQLSGDLDRIVLMALRKEADRRYQSADQFLEDINRFLAGLPVHAQSDTWVYRAGKFVSRHKIGVAATSLVAILLVLATGIALQAAITTARQNEQIQIALEKKDQVKDMMIGMFEVADPEIARGREITARELLDRSTARIELELADQPDVQAEMFHVVGTVYRQLGYLEEAKPLLERALLMRRDLFSDQVGDELAQSVFDMAVWYEEHGQVGDADQSLVLHEEALSMRETLYSRPHASIAESLNDLGVVNYWLLGDIDRARQLWTEALEMRLELEGPASRNISETMVNLGAALQDGGDYEGAERYYREGLAMQRELLGNDHPFVAATLYNLGSLLFDLGSYKEAAGYVREAVMLRRTLYGEQHFLVANGLNMLGQVLYESGDLAEADSLLRRALELHLVDLGRDNSRVGRDRQILARVSEARGNREEAVELLLEAIRVYDVFFSEPHWLLAEARKELAAIRLEQNRLGEAEDLLRGALEIYVDWYGEESDQVAVVRLLLGTCLTRAGRYDEAEPHLVWSKTYYENQDEATALDLSEARQALDEFYRLSGRSRPVGS